MNARIRERNKLSRFHATATLDREADIGNPALLDFFVSACEAVFGQMDGSISRDGDSLKWGLNTAAKMTVRIRPGQGETNIHIDAQMFKFWYFTIHVLLYVVLWNIFAMVMYFLGVGLIDPLVVPGLFMLFSALRFGSIGLCLLILHLILRSRRKRAFDAAFATLVSAIENFLEIETDVDDPNACRESILRVLPKTGRGPVMADLHFSIFTKWRINPDMGVGEKDKLNNAIRTAGFSVGFMDYRLDIKTFKPVGFILRGGSKIQISLSPRSEGTQIDFWSDISGFVPVMTILTTVGIVAVVGILIGYFHAMEYGVLGRMGEFFENLFWGSLFVSIGLWNAVRAIILWSRRSRIEEGAPKLVQMLEKTEETAGAAIAAAREMPEVIAGAQEPQREVPGPVSLQAETGNRSQSIEELSGEEREEIAVWLKEKGESPEDYLDDKQNWLNLSSADITDTDIARIRSISSLQELDLSGNPITDRGLAGFSGMAELRELNLRDTLVTGYGLQQLIGCPDLNSVEVDQRKIKLMPVIRAGCARLFSGISILNLPEQGVTDDDLEYLTGFAVQMLNLDMNQITGTGLIHLEGLTDLKFLNIASNPLRTEMLSHLKGHGNLEYLNIQNTNIDEEEILDLKRDMPWLKISSDYEIDGSFSFRLRMALYGVKGIIYKVCAGKGDRARWH